MALHPLAGKPAPPEVLVDVGRLEREFLERTPDPGDPRQRVKFGTSGHRGTPLDGSLTRRTSSRSPRPSATTAAGRGSTARSSWARTRTRCRRRRRTRPSRCWPPTASRPSSSATTASRRRRSSRARSWPANRGRTAHLADGIVITPSHNPPEDGGFKYNPPNGGPADTDVTRWISSAPTSCWPRATATSSACRSRRRCSAPTTHQEDFVGPYVEDLHEVVDMEAIRDAGSRSASIRSAARRCPTGSQSPRATA